jgi:hypothetical protein
MDKMCSEPLPSITPFLHLEKNKFRKCYYNIKNMTFYAKNDIIIAKGDIYAIYVRDSI